MCVCAFVCVSVCGCVHASGCTHTPQLWFASPCRQGRWRAPLQGWYPQESPRGCRRQASYYLSPSWRPWAGAQSAAAQRHQAALNAHTAAERMLRACFERGRGWGRAGAQSGRCKAKGFLPAHLRGHEADAAVVAHLGHELLRSRPASELAVSKTRSCFASALGNTRIRERKGTHLLLKNPSRPRVHRASALSAANPAPARPNEPCTTTTTRTHNKVSPLCPFFPFPPAMAVPWPGPARFA